MSSQASSLGDERAKQGKASIMKDVVGSSGTKMPIKPIPTSARPSTSHPARATRPRRTRSFVDASTETGIDMGLHSRKGFERSLLRTLFLVLA